MFEDINNDTYVFHQCIRHEKCTIYRNGCKCKECKDFQSYSNQTIESYILRKWKSEACTCKKCCWCVYKSYYHTEPKKMPNEPGNSHKSSEVAGKQQSRKSYHQMLVERQQDNNFALEE